MSYVNTDARARVGPCCPHPTQEAYYATHGEPEPDYCTTCGSYSHNAEACAAIEARRIMRERRHDRRLTRLMMRSA